MLVQCTVTMVTGHFSESAQYSRALFAQMQSQKEDRGPPQVGSILITLGSDNNKPFTLIHIQGISKFLQFWKGQLSVRMSNRAYSNCATVWMSSFVHVYRRLTLSKLKSPIPSDSITINGSWQCVKLWLQPRFLQTIFSWPFEWWQPCRVPRVWSQEVSPSLHQGVYALLNCRCELRTYTSLFPYWQHWRASSHKKRKKRPWESPTVSTSTPADRRPTKSSGHNGNSINLLHLLSR